MKKILFICVVSLWPGIQTHAQLRDSSLNTNTYKVDADRLFQKAKKQKTAAWIFLGAGAGMAITGLGIILGEAAADATGVLTTVVTLGLYNAPEPKHSAAGPILAIAGTGAMLGSIPLFTASGNNKRKANIMLKHETVSFNPQLNIKEHLASIGIKIEL